MTSLTADTSRGSQHIIEVLKRWWLLIMAGTVIAVAFGAVAGLRSPAHYTADAQVLINQPAQALDRGQTDAVQRLSQLLKTIAELAKGDDVLDQVRLETRTERSRADLRDRVTTGVVPDTLIIELRVDVPTSDEAGTLASSLVAVLQDRIGKLFATSADPTARLTAETVQVPEVKKVSSGVARTIAFAFILGFGFSLVAAFALDRG